LKTTDAYRISLDTIVGYREKLAASGQLQHPSSILIVVGREDTGELEAQVRGSRHAWDIRLISADALIKLVELKEDAEGPETGKKIRSLLTPMEYTRLDDMIDVMFTTAKDVESAVGAEAGQDQTLPESVQTPDKVKGTWQFTDSTVLQAKRESIIAALAQREGTSLIKKSRALFWNSSHDVRAACTVSKRYTIKGGAPYWYAYHPQWDEFLGESERSFAVFGCMDREMAFAVPLKVMRSVLDALNTTQDRFWHVFLTELAGGDMALVLSKQKSTLPIKQYVLSLSSNIETPDTASTT